MTAESATAVESQSLPDDDADIYSEPIDGIHDDDDEPFTIPEIQKRRRTGYQTGAMIISGLGTIMNIALSILWFNDTKHANTIFKISTFWLLIFFLVGPAAFVNRDKGMELMKSLATICFLYWIFIMVVAFTPPKKKTTLKKIAMSGVLILSICGFLVLVYSATQ